MASDRPFTTGQAAEYCHVSQATIINWIKDRKLKGYTTPGGHYRIPPSDLVSFLENHDMPVDAALRRSARTRLLVLSDNRTIRELAETLQEDNGFEACLVTSDYAASAEAAQLKPDAVIIDVNTSSDPRGLCQWLNETMEHTALLVVGDEPGKEIIGALAADDYISLAWLVNRPATTERLKAKLEALLQ
jgi:excisionase family DNA binding protein